MISIRAIYSKWKYLKISEHIYAISQRMWGYLKGKKHKSDSKGKRTLLPKELKGERRWELGDLGRNKNAV